MLWPALFGPDSLINPMFGVIYVWLWVGLVPASLLFGRFYRAVSPVRTLYLLLARARVSRPRRTSGVPSVARLLARCDRTVRLRLA